MSSVALPRSPVRWLPLFLIGLACALLIAQQILVFPGHTRLSATIHNAMHVPWSAALAFIVWKLTGRWRHVLPIMFCIAAGSEGLQLITTRSASLEDFFADLLGTCLAGCIYGMFVASSRRTVWLPILGILCIGLYTLRPIAMVYASEAWLDARETVLFDASDPRGVYLAEFTADADYNMFSMDGVHLTLTDQPWSGVHFTVFPGVRQNPTHIQFDVTIDGDEPLTLGISARYPGDDEPIWVEHQIAPGRSSLRIPVAHLIRKRPLARIQDLYLYGYHTDAGRRFTVHRVEFVLEEV